MPTDSPTPPARSKISRAAPPRLRMEAPAELERFTERQFQDLLIDCARMMGWHCVHIRQMIGNPEGLPDLLLWRDDAYRLFELKTVKGVLSGIQVNWHATAASSGVAVYLLRPTPADWERAMDLLA